MSRNETIFTIFSLALLTVLILRFFNISNSSYDTSAKSQEILSAAGYGQSLIEEINLRKFDEQTITNQVNDVNSLTVFAQFGPDAGETSLSQYDDIDDFKGYTKIDTLAGVGVFTSRANIYYVPESDINITATPRSFLKKIVVYSKKQSASDSLKLEYIVNY